MIDFIPLEYYSFTFYQFLMVVCLITLLHSLVLKGNESKVYGFNNVFAIFVLLVLITYIGLRPISGRYFVDMKTYANTFYQFKNGMEVSLEGDFGFEYFIKFCSLFLNIELFFTICATIYILPLYIASKNWFPKHYFFSFLLLVCSFSFWPYGVNGMRNGMATSLFVLAISYMSKSNAKMILFLIISYMFHKSMTLPICAFILTYFIKDTHKYYAFWFLSIVISLALGGFLENIFMALNLFGGDRLSAYLSGGEHSSGFRFDFLLYSFAPIALSYVYIYKRGFDDEGYKRILHTYLISNAFWVMIIRANFSNRFAYLSWFLMALVVCYPLLKKWIFDNQFKRLGLTALIYYSFTYLMYYYYKYLR